MKITSSENRRCSRKEGKSLFSERGIPARQGQADYINDDEESRIRWRRNSLGFPRNLRRSTSFR